jgi:phosphoribosyl-AMP cyclohydrolase
MVISTGKDVKVLELSYMTEESAKWYSMTPLLDFYSREIKHLHTKAIHKCI